MMQKKFLDLLNNHQKENKYESYYFDILTSASYFKENIFYGLSSWFLPKKFIFFSKKINAIHNIGKKEISLDIKSCAITFISLLFTILFTLIQLNKDLLSTSDFI